MLILGIESASLVASAALVEDDAVIAEYTVNNKKTHSQTLLPMIDEIFRMTERTPEMLDAVAVAAGPGSFTGLRIGSATAKGIALACDIPVIPVPTTDAMAYQFYGCAHRICPILDARRSEVYTGIYRFERDFEVLMPASAMPLAELMEKLKEEPGPVVFTGDGISVFKERITAALGEDALFAPPMAARQRAAAVASRGQEMFRNGISQTSDEHVPEYLRVSQAERVRAEKEKQK